MGLVLTTKSSARNSVIKRNCAMKEQIVSTLLAELLIWAANLFIDHKRVGKIHLISFFKYMWLMTRDMGHVTPDTWHVKSDAWQISAPKLLRFGSEGFLNILTQRITTWLTHLITKVFEDHPWLHLSVRNVELWKKEKLHSIIY